MEDKNLKTDIIQSHDKFIKTVLSNKKDVVNFLKNYLPEDIKCFIDFKKIQIIKESFIDERLRTTYSDILLRINLKESDAYIYILFEHKSKPDKFTGLQLLKYMVSIWDRLIKNNRNIKKLPVIIPYVFYHGKKSWNLGTEFYDIIAKNELPKQYQVNFEYILQDLSKYSNDALRGNRNIRLSMITMKYIFSHDVFRILVQEAGSDINKLLGTKEGSEFFKKLLIYILSNQEIQLSEIENIVKKEKIKKGDEIIMTTAEKLINKGRQEGMQQGMQQGIRKERKEMLKRLLTVKFRKINKSQSKIIDQCGDTDKLEKALEKIIPAHNIDVILNELN